jgi:hypothetical protein
MRILIAFYSKTGGTERVSQVLKEEFERRGHSVETEKIVPREEHSFWGWSWRRMLKGDCDIRPPKIRDVSRFDLICLGSPNWTRLALPVARYIKEIDGLKHKNIGFFATTFAPPVIERYFLSAYLLDTTFSWQISRKGGRVVDSLLLSSFFKKWDVVSANGKKLVKNFCDKLGTPLSSLKKYFLERKEIENTRFLVVLFSFILFFSLVLQFLSGILGKYILSWGEFSIIFAIEVFIYLIILTILTSRAFILLGKYLAGLALVFGLTVAVMFLLPSMGRPIILSYVLVLIVFIFFRDPKTIFFVGTVVFLSYSYLYYVYPLAGVLSPSLDLPFILLNIIIVGFIAKNLQDHFFDLLDAQEEIETARAVLEIKVDARTRELKELSASLEEQVAERTSSLREKIEELERFNKLTVGRELKMISLKEEIEQLRQELKKNKSKAK